jgi:hypothetical protein
MNSSYSGMTPSLYVKRRGEQTTKLELSITRAKQRHIVRLTGGCGYMSAGDTAGLYELFTKAFRGFEGAILFGGTRMLQKDDVEVIVPGITEIAPLIRQTCPGSVILGVVPKSEDLRLTQYGLVVSDEVRNDYLTIVHPEQDQCLIVQQSADEGVDWDAEWQECLRIIGDLRQFAQWQSVLVAYNGGSVTEREILATAEQGWPVILIAGSGRKTDEYAMNADFIKQYPNVMVVEKSSESLRRGLIALGAIEATE